MFRIKTGVWVLILTILLSSCINLQQAPGTDPIAAQSSSAVSPAAQTAAPTNSTPPSIWVDPDLPGGFLESLPDLSGIPRSANAENAAIRIQPDASETPEVRWVYALAAPFPTVLDDVSLSGLKSLWLGRDPSWAAGKPLLLSPSTRRMFEQVWGKPSPDSIRELPEGELLEAAWADQPAWALIPFEQISPRWKVLRVNGLSPLDKTFDPAQYPLTVGISTQGSPEALSSLPEETLNALNSLPAGNRDPEKMTVLVMTGVTALVRATGAKMEKEGMTYPAEDIHDWLALADLTHISNEVSFEPTCPPANPNATSLMFCSRPEYLELLEYVGADMIELTGNHLKDWRNDSFDYTLKLLAEHGMKYYGAGWNLEEARQPLLIEDHGNRLAFIGCNPAGPKNVWADEDSPGVASCDYETMKAEISRLTEEGYLVIASLQYFEHYAMVATPYQQRDYPPLAEAGAVIVSGSQAHLPQTMTFVNDSFIHYGLGNLFFDQMDRPVKGTRREFIDRHVFYDGRYLGVELLTAYLEDYSRPRPMDEEERAAFLQEAFDTAKW